jgi:hypothetical protein
MSINITHHIILGVKLPFDALSDEKREKLRDFGDTQPSGFEVIIDGMGSQYIIVGKPIARFSEEEPLPPTQVHPYMADPDGTVPTELAATFAEYFGEVIEQDLDNLKYGVWAVSHIR